jgi:16S rRNA G966 N2-methylase RsmD
MLVSGRVAELLYLVRNRLNGIDLEFVSAEELGLSPERSHYHSNSGGPDCARVFKSLRIPPGSVVVDLGSGKGGAVMTLRQLPFAEIIGVEISPKLIDIAMDNVARLGLEYIRFVQSDAAAFTDFDRVTHIYMYNPFPCQIVARVMTNIAESIGSAARDLTLIYRNPVCDDAIRASGVFEKTQTMQVNEHEWSIYRYLPQPRRSEAAGPQQRFEWSAPARSARHADASVALSLRQRQE